MQHFQVNEIRRTTWPGRKRRAARPACRDEKDEMDEQGEGTDKRYLVQLGLNPFAEYTVIDKNNIEASIKFRQLFVKG